MCKHGMLRSGIVFEVVIKGWGKAKNKFVLSLFFSKLYRTIEIGNRPSP